MSFNNAGSTVGIGSLLGADFVTTRILADGAPAEVILIFESEDI